MTRIRIRSRTSARANMQANSHHLDRAVRRKSANRQEAPNRKSVGKVGRTASEAAGNQGEDQHKQAFLFQARDAWLCRALDRVRGGTGRVRSDYKSDIDGVAC